ncbi:MAG: hypothetical protein WC911_03655 [Thermoleophilia bacterium]
MAKNEARLSPTLLREQELNDLKNENKSLKARLNQFEMHRNYSILRNLAAVLEDLEDVAGNGWQNQTPGRSSGQNGSGGSGDQVVADFLLEFEKGIRNFAADGKNFLSDRQDNLLPESGAASKEKYRPWIICGACSRLAREKKKNGGRGASGVKFAS